MFVTESWPARQAWVTSKLAQQMMNHVIERSLGMAFAGPVDVRLTPYDVVVPDILFISQSRLPIFGERAVNAAPDLIVEVLSPSTRLRDLNQKMKLYARTGVAEYWVVDTDRKSIAVHALNAKGAYESVPQPEDGIASRVLPELSLTISELFAGLD
jgi:Uma2 family endonuclease